VARLTHAPGRTPTIRATSAGGIVVRFTDQGPEIVLGRRLRPRDGVTWTLPKGTPDAGESIDRTALREVQEETGLEVRIAEPVGSIEYSFAQGGARIHKTVHYFVMEVTGGSLAEHDDEFDEVRWVQLSEAASLMSHETERGIVERSLPVVRTLGGSAGRWDARETETGGHRAAPVGRSPSTPVDRSSSTN
jgi:8-oxo-dGTP pyrophosphatase MutT (NUDIX family)